MTVLSIRSRPKLIDSEYLADFQLGHQISLINEAYSSEVDCVNQLVLICPASWRLQFLGICFLQRPSWLFVPICRVAFDVYLVLLIGNQGCF